MPGLGVQLQVEGCSLDGLLLLARQLGQAIGERISNPELHVVSLELDDHGHQPTAGMNPGRPCFAPVN